MPVEKRKVMMIDDNIINLVVVEELLAGHGYDVVTLSAPHGVRAKIDYEMPDILLLDISMPRLAADDLIEALQRSTEHEDLVIVLYADMDPAELEKVCHAKDIHGYFSKSMDAQRLPEFVDQFFEG
jgi:response regulator RpfG family c-di-GMP phosphodiesterase